MITYKQTETGQRYILGYNAFNTDYLNSLAYQYGYRSNRVYGDVMDLPYNYDNIKILPNELINSDTINTKIELLYKNYVYILTKCSIGKIDGLESFKGSSYLPYSIYNTPHTGDLRMDYKPQLTDTLLDQGIRSMAMCPNSDEGVDSMILATANRLMLCRFTGHTGNNQSHTISMISTSGSEMLVDSENDLEFKSIKKIVTNNKGGLFTLDTGRDIIYKHNIRGLTRGDRILNHKETAGRMLDVMVGKSGDIDSKIQFSNPIDIEYHRDRLYVLDGGSRNYRIKVYDDQINWLDTYNISLDFLSHSPISIAGNTDSIFILTDSGTVIQYNIDSLNSGNLEAVKSSAVSIIDTDYNTEEKYIEIKFSPINDNTCYIVTNKSVYKLMVDKIDKLVGKVDWSKHSIATSDLSPICIGMFPQYNAIGINAVVVADAKIPNQNRTHETLLLHFTDSDNMMNMMNDQYESNIIKYDNITIKPEEYVSPFVYNKMIAKLLHNLNVIYNHIVYIISNEISSAGSFNYPGIRYVSEEELNEFRLNDTLENTLYIGVNELVSSATINRCLRDIIDKQVSTMLLIRDRNNLPEFYYNSVNKLKRLPVPVVESYLASGYRYRIQKIE
jgi:hypothetical protein